MDFKATLNLPDPSSAIPMKADLAKREPDMQACWDEMGLYRSIISARREAGAPPFVLHDGPPYTNGPIHLGTSLNKILKDFVVKSQSLMGRRAPYVPGYDNHGLPIEQAVMKSFNEKKITPTTVELRRACRQHAEHYIGVQTDQFKRLGVFGLWDKPYTSMAYKYEAEIIRVFKRIVEGGYVYRGLRPVLWSPTSQTALADTEIVYKDHVSVSIYVKFPLSSDPDGVFDGLPNLSTVIWTTTPWTIPANLAVAFHPSLDYVVVRSGDQHLVMAEALYKHAFDKVGLKIDQVVKTIPGSAIEGARFKHPVFDRHSVAVLADYVTTEDGTGVVHTAPGHGREDFMTGQKYGLPVLCPVDGRGVLTDEAGEFSGVYYAKCDTVVVERLRELGMLLLAEEYSHSYPHAERDDQPVIFRATEQWFIGIDHPFHLEPSITLRQKMLEEVDRTKWFPRSGYDRFRGMIAGRPDWCISRQRPWGVGIPVFYGAGTGEPVLDPEAIEAVAALVEREGSDAWYERQPADILPKGYKHPSTGETDFTKEVDVFDVWFDSGCTALCVFRGAVDSEWKEDLPVDIYLEGSDQHRGWFNVSMILATATEGFAPYRHVVTHGFVTDEHGRKQSKRLGNVIDPVQVCSTSGADVLRYWVASIDYETDMPCSEAILKAVGDEYRAIRNYLRFLQMNLSDFEPGSKTRLDGIDQWIVGKTHQLAETVLTHYRQYEFNRALSAFHNFCVNTLSKFYLDAIKDTMYCDAVGSPSRRAAQTACHEVLSVLVTLISPILCHTADEVYALMKHSRQKPSVFHEVLEPRIPEGFAELDQQVQALLELRAETFVAFDKWREDMETKDSQDVGVVVTAQADTVAKIAALGADLPNLFKMASVDLRVGEPGTVFQVSQFDKCQRSRLRRSDVEVVEYQGEQVPLTKRDRQVLGL